MQSYPIARLINWITVEKSRLNTSIEKLSFTSVNRLYNKSNGTKNRPGYNMV